MKSESTRNGTPLFTYGLLVVTVTHALTHVFQYIHIAIFPILMGPNEFNLSLQQLGVIVAIPPLCQALLAIPIGLLTDRYGCKRMLIVSMIVAAVGSLFAFYAMNPFMLTLAVSLVYVNTVIYHPASYSLTTRLFRSENRSKALGIHGAGGTFGMALGPISVSILMTFFALSWRQVYLFWFIPMLIGLLLVLMLRSEPIENYRDEVQPQSSQQTVKTSLFNVGFILFLVFLIVRNLGLQMFSPFLTVFFVDERGLEISLASMVLGASTLMGIISAPIGGFLASKFGDKRWLLMTLTLALILVTGAIIIPNNYVLITLYISYGFCSSLGWAAHSSITATLSPSRQRGLGYAFYFLPSEIMGVAAPLIATSLAATFGLTSLFIISFAIQAVSIAVLKFGVKI